jgi:hypothetical protein
VGIIVRTGGPVPADGEAVGWREHATQKKMLNRTRNEYGKGRLRDVRALSA